MIISIFVVLLKKQKKNTENNELRYNTPFLHEYFFSFMCLLKYTTTNVTTETQNELYLLFQSKHILLRNQYMPISGTFFFITLHCNNDKYLFKVYTNSVCYLEYL